MKATITIDMDNAAFADDAAGELGRILVEVSKRIAGADFTDPYDRKVALMDSNGNMCGSLIVTND